MFIPTTIFDMIWGVRYLQDAHGMDYGSAVMRSATVPIRLDHWLSPVRIYFGSNRSSETGDYRRRSRVVYLSRSGFFMAQPEVFPPYVIGLVAGIASGAAMLPYTIIKEANPPQFGGTATGVVNFLNFTFSALLGPVFGWILQSVSGGAAAN